MRYLLPEHRELPRYAHAIIRDLIEAGHAVESAAGLGSDVPSGEVPDYIIASLPLLRVALPDHAPVLDMDAGLLPIAPVEAPRGDAGAGPDPEPAEGPQSPSEAPSGAFPATLADEITRAVAEAVRIAVAEVLAKHLAGEEGRA